MTEKVLLRNGVMFSHRKSFSTYLPVKLGLVGCCMGTDQFLRRRSKTDITSNCFLGEPFDHPHETKPLQPWCISMNNSFQYFHDPIILALEKLNE